jgi:hypothetical protein
MVIYVLLLIFFYVLVAYFEVPRMLKNRMRRELVSFIALSVLGFALAAGQILNLPLPNMNKAIEAVVRPVYQAVESRLVPPEYR